MDNTALKNRLADRVGSSNNTGVIELVPNIPKDTENKRNENEAIVAVSFVPDFAISLNEAKQRIAMLQSFVKEIMIPGVDFGVVPGCNKPTLLKPGAEKICDVYGFSKHVEVINRVEHWNEGLFHYEVKATLINKRTGFVEAEGIGCCNNREKKYIKNDALSIINTVLKMAKKRALVDAVLSATRSSDIFTQDVEDLDLALPPSRDTMPLRESAAYKENITQKSEALQSNSADKNQTREISKLLGVRNIPSNKARLMMLERYKVNDYKLLSQEQARDFIMYLQSLQ